MYFLLKKLKDKDTKYVNKVRLAKHEMTEFKKKFYLNYIINGCLSLHKGTI